VAGVPKHPRQDLEYPLSRPPRTAVLGQEMRGGLKIRNFAGYRSQKLAQFAPESLAAPSDTIRALAQSIEEGEVQWRPLRQALIVFTDVVRGALSVEDRDYFWRVFQVPIFEQFRGFAGELLAQECEAHEGMHIHVPNVIFERAADGQLLVSFLRNPRAPLFRLATNLTGEICEGRCECGQTAPRLLEVRRRAATGASSRRSVAVVNSLV
jgi:phenylacetate-coenzyme A ligase PaaK-like adenylate-forming protein